MSVVFSDAIVVVDRLAICAFDSELMKDVIANPQCAHRRADASARIILAASPTIRSRYRIILGKQVDVTYEYTQYVR